MANQSHRSNRIFRFFESRVEPFPDSGFEFKDKSFFGFIGQCVKGMGPWMWLFAFLTAGQGALEALLFQFMQLAMDWAQQLGPRKMLEQKSAELKWMAAALAITPLWVGALTAVHFQTVSPPYQTRLRWGLHRHMLKQSLNFFENEFSGRVSSRIMQTTSAATQLVMNLIDNIIYLVIFFVGVFFVLAGFSPFMLLPFAVWGVIFACVLFHFIPKVSVRAKNAADKRSRMLGRITDIFANIATVKLFAHTERENEYVRDAMGGYLQANFEQNRLLTQLELSLSAMNMLLVFSVVALGLALWQAGETTVGALGASTAMTLRLMSMSHWIMFQSQNMFENVGAIKDGLEMFAKPIELKDDPQAKALQYKAGEIRFAGMGFSYIQGQPIFEGFNLRIAPGEKVGVVGRSGAGKSTLVNLLLRFFDVDQGAVLVDGQDVRKITQKSLRQAIGMVTQDTSLLHRSVRDNIAYGKPGATDEEIVRAAQAAKADAFVEALIDGQGRKGYDAYVGERGVRLSGGQRQRIAIARVILKNAPILLLDEATSALDSEVEEAIQESLSVLMAGKTVIAIAHRLSTIAKMDRLVVLDQGRIAEMGAHEELLRRGGLYAKLWRHQSGGFLPELLEEEPDARSASATSSSAAPCGPREAADRVALGEAEREKGKDAGKEPERAKDKGKEKEKEKEKAKAKEKAGEKERNKDRDKGKAARKGKSGKDKAGRG